MKYSIVAAAIIGLAVAVPTPDEPYKQEEKTTSSAAAWEPTSVKPDPPKNTWEEVKDGDKDKPKGDKTTTSTWEEVKPTEKPQWTSAKVDDKKCSYTTVYTTTYYEKEEDKKWGNGKVETMTSTVYPDKCTSWSEYVKPTEKPQWTSAKVEEKKCSYTTTYTTTYYEKEEDKKWGNGKVETKTSTVYPESCTSWAEYTTTSSTTTWAEVSKTPVAASSMSSSTWAEASVKVSPTIAAPVAKWTGAADKQTFGMGAIAIAAVAALL